MKVGDKFSAEDVIVFNSDWFEQDLVNPRNVMMKYALHQLWPTATLRDDAHARSLAPRDLPSRSPSTSATAAALLLEKIDEADPDRGGNHLLLRGTPFQVRVRSALMRIPRGRLLSYRQLANPARHAGGSAQRRQRDRGQHLGYLVPCHRLIRADGDAGEFRWGSERKLAMLAWEAS